VLTSPRGFMFEFEGFILAGGASSRMGQNKARLRLGGQTFVARVAAALHVIAPQVSVVSVRPDSAGSNLPVVPDVFRDCGALGGLHAALKACRASWAAVVSCDLPFVTGELLSRLATRATPAHDAVAPRQTDGRVQPLCALYRPAVCLARAEELLRAGELRPRVLLQHVRTRLVLPVELDDLPNSDLLLMNVNTPDDFARAQEIIERQTIDD
jgi:molybdopterin-guanine dinucleotide biosynthesis protein A